MVNGVTKEEAAKKEVNIWKEVETETEVILVSPEMITSPGFQYLVNSKAFCTRLYAICFDEVHLLNTWGNTPVPGVFHCTWTGVERLYEVGLKGVFWRPFWPADAMK